MKHTKGNWTQIHRDQDVTELIGRIVLFPTGNMAVITGNNPKNGFVEFNGDSAGWIGFDHLRDSVTCADVTGWSARKILQTYRNNAGFRFTKEKHIKMRLKQAIKKSQF